MSMQGREYAGNGGEGMRYGYNGQERLQELNSQGDAYEFEYRIHDARVGRFLSVDPLYKEYPWNSTYAFAENDVIRCIDIEGLEKWFAQSKSSAKLYNTFLSLININKLLKDELYSPTHIKSKENNVQVYLFASTQLSYSANMNPDNFFNEVKSIWNFSRMTDKEKVKYKEDYGDEAYNSINNKLSIFEEANFDFKRYYKDFKKGIKIHALYIDANQNLTDQMNSFAHEIKLHLINDLNNVEKTEQQEHDYGYGEDAMKKANGFTPSVKDTPANSPMGKIYNEIKKAIKQMKISKESH
jgi:RHS repeat-associated protein